MYYLTDRIRAISDVIDVVMSKKAKTTGRYYVLINKENVPHVREKLTKNSSGGIKKLYQTMRAHSQISLKDHRELGFHDQIASPKVTILLWLNQQKALMSSSVSSLPSGENNQDAPNLDRVWGAQARPKSTKQWSGNRMILQSRVLLTSAKVSCAKLNGKSRMTYSKATRNEIKSGN